MPITIPADLTIVTLRNSSGVLPQRFTEEYAETLLQSASELLRSRIDIAFRKNATQSVIEEMPGETRSDVVTEAGYHYLASVYRATAGVRVLFVDSVDRAELGGQSRYQTRVCLISYRTDEGSAATRVLAHELGHLLELPHVDEIRISGPGREREVAARMRNLMYSGALNPAAELNASQRATARGSAVARRFGGR